MTKASDNIFPRLLISEGGSTATPDTGNVTVYAKANGLLYSKDDAGVETLVSSGAGSGVEPWHIPIDVFSPLGQTNWTTLNYNSTEINSADIYSSGAQNDEIYWDIGASGGTWTIVLWYVKSANQGIYTVSIDGVSVGTIDGYAAGTTYNNKSSITGVSITAGQRRLKLQMATKNGSSSGYFGEINNLTLNRTA